MSKKKTGNDATKYVAVRLPKDIKDALTRIAEDDTRSVSSLIHKILKAYVTSEQKRGGAK